MKSKKTFLIIITFFLLLANYPYVFCQFLPLPPLEISIGLGFILVVVMSLSSGSYKLHPILRVTFLCQLFFWFFLFVFHNDTTYLTRNVFLITTVLILQLMVKYDILKTCQDLNCKWLCIQSILSLITFVLVFLGQAIVFFEFENTDGRLSSFFGLACSNVHLGNFARMSGFFDEPGALAFWGIYALIINKIFINNRFVEYCLIIGLVSTLSLAYFIQLSLYLLCFNVGKIKHIIPLVILLLIVFVGISKYSNDTETLNVLTIERFDNLQRGNTNRSDQTKIAKSYFSKAPLLGNGANNIDKAEYMNDNPYELLAKDGIIGTIVIYLPLILLLFRSKNLQIRLGVIILLVGYMQRPFHINFVHFFMLYSFLYLSLNLMKQEKRILGVCAH